MACTRPDGSLAPVAATVLRALAAAGQRLTVEALAERSALPAYRARSTVRALRAAGLVREEGGGVVVTDAGRARLTA